MWRSRWTGGGFVIYLTGDTHGDFRRFKAGEFPELDNLTKADYVIICGDFGGVWDTSREQQYWLNWLEERPFTTLFVTGNHENYDLLAEYPTEEWRGGTVQRIRPSVIHLTRGQIFELEGKRFFAMGGAACHDIMDGVLEPDDPQFRKKYRELRRRDAYFRINHVSWWKEELPSAAEYKTALNSLERVGWDVDYVITHCAPTSVQNAIVAYGYESNELTDFLESVSKRLQFRLWFFGHYHSNFMVRKKYILLYQKIVQLQL